CLSSAPSSFPSFPTRRSSDLLLFPALLVVSQIPGDGPHYPALFVPDCSLRFDPCDSLQYSIRQFLHAPFSSANSLWSHSQHRTRSEEHTSELQSRENLVCRLL